MKLFVRIVLVTAVILVSSGTVYANDASMGRMGETVYPLQETDVTMVSEEIFIKFYADGSSGKVTCEFVFENSGEEKTVLMGFPAAMKIDYEALTTEERVSLNNFTAFKNGMEILVAEVESSEMEGDFSKYPTWHVFEVPFEAGETLTMTHTYDVNFTFYSEGSISIGYILETGSTWNDSIGHSKVTFDLSEIEPWGIEMYNYPSIDDFRYSDGRLIFEKWDFKPDFNLEIMTNARYFKEYSGPWELSETVKERQQFYLDSLTMTKNELIDAYNGLSYEQKFIETVWLNGRLEIPDETVENPKTDNVHNFYRAGLFFFVLAISLTLIKRKRSWG